MEIILKEDIIGLGYKNDIVKVKSGYGRNYLIPTGKGVIASESAKKVLAENLRQQACKIAAAKAEAEKRAAEWPKSNIKTILCSRVYKSLLSLWECKVATSIGQPVLLVELLSVSS